MINAALFRNLKSDALAGLVVFLIALPLCLGIALASGAPLYSGVVSGIIGGVLIGVLSKSPLSVSGPANSTMAITLVSVSFLGSFELFLCSVILAGVFQFIFGLLKMGFISSYFPSSVVEGMLAAIGIIIIMKQIPYMVGYDLENAPEFMSLESGWQSIKHTPNHVSLEMLIIGILSLLILILWEQPFMKKLKFIPVGLVVVLIGTFLAEFFKNSQGMILSEAYFVDLPVAKNIKEFISQFHFPNWEGFTKSYVWQTGFSIAIIASLESLLSIEAIDKLDPHKRYTPTSLELSAQGIGNIISGLLGGLPITSVIVRSSANLNAGAKSKLAAIIHGILLLLFVALIPSTLNKMPLASLAAILVMVGYKLCKPSVFIYMWKNGGYAQFIPFIATFVSVVYFDLLNGVAIGMAVSLLFILRQSINNPFHYKQIIYSKKQIFRILLSQKVTFLNKSMIKKTLDKMPINAHLIIDATRSIYIDFDALELFREFRDFKAEDRNINVCFVGFKENLHYIRNTPEEKLIPAEILSTNEPPKSRISGNCKKLLKELGI